MILHPEEWAGLCESSCRTNRMRMVAERGEEGGMEEEQVGVVEGLTGMEEQRRNRGKK